ncbi:hypothetical protein DL991_23305 [Amycolatopsis sp. WAC 01375]|nr:hypothetical protein DL991_23305 [Amycolatopsis sp. WAC 01375]
MASEGLSALTTCQIIPARLPGGRSTSSTSEIDGKPPLLFDELAPPSSDGGNWLTFWTIGPSPVTALVILLTLLSAAALPPTAIAGRCGLGDTGAIAPPPP